MTPIRRHHVAGAEPDQDSAAAEYLLVCQAQSTSLSDGRWQFIVERADGTPVLEASDEEHGDLNRLTLLAALRGLESFDGPATLTLLSVNRYLIRSLTDSLKRWRENGFVWEHYGRQIDVQHADLWRRIDRTLQIHRVDACLVSRRTVSAGTKGEPSNSLGPDRHLRFDRPTNPVRRPNFDRAMKKTGEVADPPTDRLRSWLLGIGEESPEHMRSPRRRATDLFELT